ncbi:MAG: flagellar hook-length control protein FliK [Clostridia bacterium]|nr:flagellar hook-length control protein FliK [Clostridia bacterium]
MVAVPVGPAGQAPVTLSPARGGEGKPAINFANILRLFISRGASFAKGLGQSGEFQGSIVPADWLPEALLTQGILALEVPQPGLPAAGLGLNSDPGESAKKGQAGPEALLAALLLAGCLPNSWGTGFTGSGPEANWPGTGLSPGLAIGLLALAGREGPPEWVAAALETLKLNEPALGIAEAGARPQQQPVIGQSAGDLLQTPQRLAGTGMQAQGRHPTLRAYLKSPGEKQPVLPAAGSPSTAAPASQANGQALPPAGLVPLNPPGRREGWNGGVGQGDGNPAGGGGCQAAGVSWARVSSRGEALPGLNFPEIAARIVEKMQLTRRQGRSELEIKLKPESLGSLHLKLTWQDGRLGVQMLAESRQAGQALENSLPELRRLLQQQGVNVGEMEVQVGSQSESGGYFLPPDFSRRSPHEVKVMAPGFSPAQPNTVTQVKSYNHIDYLA